MTPVQTPVSTPQFFRTFDTSAPAQVTDPLGPTRYKGKDVPQPERRMRMHVVNRSCNALPMPHGVVLGPGHAEITVYESEVPLVLAMVEPNPAGIEDAERTFIDRVCLAVVMKDIKDREELRDLRVMSLPEQVAYVASRVDLRVNKHLDRALQMTGDSVPSVFREKHHRDILPLVSAEIVGDPLDMPELHPTRVLAGNAAAVSAPIVDALRETLGVMQQQNAALIALLTEKKAKA